jgi:3-hydroxyisobutyrate dehydrogenase-like beta-hydroxyacid dehydrogenase
MAAADSTELVAKCREIVLCLPNSSIVKTVVGEIGSDLTPNSLLIDATTGDPEDSVAMARELSSRGIEYVDATIAGSSEQARLGQATVLVGGTEGGVKRAESVLGSWSARRFHLGESGSGARMKLVVNLVLGLNRAALAEGMTLARACGIDAGDALAVLKETPAFSAIMASKGPKMASRDYAPQARLAQHLKDVELIRALAKRQKAVTPLSDVHEELLRRAVELGFGEADNSAIMEAFS